MFDILSQDKTKNLFQSSLKSGRVAHSYLIEGEEGLGKKNLALYMAAALLCEGDNKPCEMCRSCKRISERNHPDVILISEKTVKIDIIRRAIEDVYKKPYEGNKKVLIIENFHTATIESQNAILKTLEEPPKTAHIILLAENTLNILDTIISRCQILKLFRVKQELIEKKLSDLGIEEEKIHFAAGYGEGNIKRSIKATTDEFLDLRREIIDMGLSIFSDNTYKTFKYGEVLNKYKDNIDEVLNILSTLYRDIILIKLSTSEENIINRDIFEILVEESYRLSYNRLDKALKVLQDTREKLKRDSTFQLTMEVMILNIQEAK